MSIATISTIAMLSILSAWLWHSGREADEASRRHDYNAGVLDAVIQLTSGQFSSWRTSNADLGSIGLPPGVGELPLLGTVGTRAIREAAEKLTKLAESSPGRIDALYHLASAYQLLGETGAAANELEQILEIRPDFVPAAALAAEIAGTPTRLAREQLVARFGENDWRTNWFAANDARKRRAWSEAAGAYSALIELSTEPFIGMKLEAYLGRGVARLQLEQYESAQEDFHAVRLKAPSCIEATLLLGKAYLVAATDAGRRRAEELFAALNRRSSSEGDGGGSRMWIALVYTSLDEYQKALQWVDDVPVSATRERLRSYLFTRLGKYDESDRAARRAIEADPDSLVAYLLLARNLLEKIHEVQPPDPEDLPALVEACLQALEVAAMDGQVSSLLVATWKTVGQQSPDALRRKDMVNLRKRITSAALAAGIVLSAAGTGLAQAVFDDFEDGSVFDDSPVSWGPQAAWSKGIYDASSGDLVVGSNVRQDASLPVSGVFFEDRVSVRTQVSIRPGSTPSVTAFGAYLAQISTEASLKNLYILRWDGTLPITVLAEEPLPADFDPEEDHLLQLDVYDGNVEMRVWKPGEPMPENPTVEAEDERYRSGGVGINLRLGDNPPPQRGLVTFRFFQASSEMITDGIHVADEAKFLRGDANADAAVNVSDAQFTLNWLFGGDASPGCEAALDTNADDQVDIADPVSLLNFLFAGGSAPLAPFPECAPSEPQAAGTLSCAEPQC